MNLIQKNKNNNLSNFLSNNGEEEEEIFNSNLFLNKKTEN
jgi:hypothetical protein